jgi:hypothetical protein
MAWKPPLNIIYKSARSLTNEQAAFLAALLPNPKGYQAIVMIQNLSLSSVLPKIYAL